MKKRIATEKDEQSYSGSFVGNRNEVAIQMRGNCSWKILKTLQ